MALVEIVLAASWLVVLTVLVLDFAGILRRGSVWRWQGTGLLLMNGSVLIDGFAWHRGWSANQLDTLHSITFPVILAGLALLIIGLIVQVKSRRNREGQVE